MPEPRVRRMAAMQTNIAALPKWPQFGPIAATIAAQNRHDRTRERAMPQTVGRCHSVAEFLAKLVEFDIVSIAVVVDDGKSYSTHQFGMGAEDLEIASQLLSMYSQGLSGNYSVQ